MLLKQAMEQLSQDGLVEVEQVGNPSSGSTVKLFTFYQLCLKPGLDPKSRDNKELALLARALDLLKAGDVAQLSDLLAARLIAVDTATKQGWSTAKHLEVLDADQEGTVPPHVLLAAQRHGRQVDKAGGKGSWGKQHQWSWDQGGDHRGKGQGKEQKGKAKKGKPKGRGRKGGWNYWGFGDKDSKGAEKSKEAEK